MKTLIDRTVVDTMKMIDRGMIDSVMKDRVIDRMIDTAMTDRMIDIMNTDTTVIDIMIDRVTGLERLMMNQR